MSLITHDIYTLLLENGFTFLADGELTTDNDKVTAVLASEQPPSDMKDTYYQDGFQILVRGEPRAGHEVAFDVMQDVHGFLLNLPENFIANDTCYKGVEMESNIAMLGRDENERFIFSCNYSTYRSPLNYTGVRPEEREILDISTNQTAPEG